MVANQIREQFKSLSEEVEELSVTIQGVSSKGDMEMESGLGSKYPPAKPGALGCEPLIAAAGSLTRPRFLLAA